MIRKGFLAAFQVVSVYVVFEILHRWHTWGVLAAYWRWQYAMLADDTGMPSSRGSLQKDGNLLPLLLQVTLQVRPFATMYFTFLAFQCCQMLSKKQLWQWPLTLGKNTASQRTGQTSQPSLQDEAQWEVCFSQIGPAGAAQLLPRSGRNLNATSKVQLLQGRVAQDFQQVCGPIGTGVIVKAPGVLKTGLRGYTGAVGRCHIEKGTFMPSKPQSSKNLAFVGGRPYYHKSEKS